MDDRGAGAPGADGSVLVGWATGIREEPKQDQWRSQDLYSGGAGRQELYLGGAGSVFFIAIILLSSYVLYNYII